MSQPRLMFEEVTSNKLKSVLLLSLFIIIIGLLGAVFGILYGSLSFGVAIAVTVAIIYSLVGFYSGDRMILGVSGAKAVTKEENPYLYHTIEGLSLAAGMPVPKAYVIEDAALNAFATGRDPKHASIAVTTGLLNAMNRQELEGVVAHEMSHIKNLDVRFMMLTVVLVGVVTLLSDMLLRSFLWGGKGRKKELNQATAVLLVLAFVLAILTPIIGEMIKLAISRRREFLADANSAMLTRYPPGLASALRKISKDPDPLVDTANKATAHLFISMPFRHNKGFLAGLFATHPSLDERIKRLEQM